MMSKRVVQALNQSIKTALWERVRPLSAACDACDGRQPVPLQICPVQLYSYTAALETTKKSPAALEMSKAATVRLNLRQAFRQVF